MAITHQFSTGVSAVTSAKGTTSTTVAYGGVAAGRIAFITAAAKTSATTFGTITGWTNILNAAGGTGTNAADTGTDRVGVWYRVLDGTETGSVTVTGTGASCTTASMQVYSGTVGGWGVPYAIAGDDAAHGTGVSAASGAWAQTPNTGDYILCAYAADTDSTTAPSAPTLVKTGTTFAALTNRSRLLNSDGNDNSIHVYDASVTAHTAASTNLSTFGLTWASTSCGPVAFVRIHESVPIANLTDDFDDGSAGTAWSESYGGTTETGGRAQTPATTSYSGYNTSYHYSMSSAGFFVRAYPAAVNGATTGEVYSAVWLNSVTQGAGNQFGIKVDTLSGNITFENQTGYYEAGKTTLTYDPVAHAWWRVQLVSGDLVWATSPDGSTWTTRRTSAAPAYVAACSDFRVFLEAHRDSGTDNNAEWDYFNVAPSTTVNGTISDTLGALTATGVGARDVPATIATTLGSLTAAVLAIPEHPGSISTTLGALTATVQGSRLVTSTVSTTLGALAATSSGTRDVAGSTLTVLGGLSTTVDGARDVGGAVASTLGALTATVLGSRQTAGQVSTTLGSIAATASAVREAAATIVSTLGALTATALGSVQITGSSTTALGALTATADGRREFSGSVATTLGDLTATGLGQRQVSASIASTLGALSGTGAGQRDTAGSVSTTLGGLTATASALGEVQGASDTLLGGLTATASASPVGFASTTLGDLTATASAQRDVNGAASTTLGLLAATVVGSGVTVASGAADTLLGGLTASASGTRTTAAQISTALGALSTDALGVRQILSTIATQLGGLTAEALGVVTAPSGGSIQTTLGGLTATASGTRSTEGSIPTVLGGLSASALGVVVGPTPGLITTLLGGLTTTASSQREVAGWAPADLGQLVAQANGVPEKTGFSVTNLGALVATITVNSAVVVRPYTGSVTRPVGDSVVRPNTGVVVRPGSQ